MGSVKVKMPISNGMIGQYSKIYIIFQKMTIYIPSQFKESITGSCVAGVGQFVTSVSSKVFS